MAMAPNAVFTGWPHIEQFCWVFVDISHLTYIGFWVAKQDGKANATFLRSQGLAG